MKLTPPQSRALVVLRQNRGQWILASEHGFHAGELWALGRKGMCERRVNFERHLFEYRYFEGKRHGR